jgi:hypothetical protein
VLDDESLEELDEVDVDEVDVVVVVDALASLPESFVAPSLLLELDPDEAFFVPRLSVL